MRKPVKQRNRFLFNFHFLHPQKLKFHIQKFSRSRFIDPCIDIFSRNRTLKDFKRFGLEFRIRVNVKGYFLPGYTPPFAYSWRILANVYTGVGSWRGPIIRAGWPDQIRKIVIRMIYEWGRKRARGNERWHPEYGGGNLWPRNRCVPEGRYIPFPKNIIRKGGGCTSGRTH